MRDTAQAHIVSLDTRLDYITNLGHNVSGPFQDP